MIAWECIGRTVVAPAGVTVILIARNKVTWFNVNDTDSAWNVACVDTAVQLRMEMSRMTIARRMCYVAHMN